MKQGVIFDLDGVLISTDEMHYKAWKSIADELGIPFGHTENNLLRGVSRMASLDIILNLGNLVLSEKEKEALAERKNNRYVALLQSLTPDVVTAEVRDTLALLHKRGIKTAVGSSSRNAKLILRLTDLEKYFDAVSDGTNISRSKPDPEVFLKGAEFLGLSPDDCAVTEDAVAGIDAANAGGFYSIGIGDAAAYEKADARITSISELLDLV
ncbi:MAG: beta-phosphoglucomutase [Lachnospiraceae bacterium]|nr:beta-phosphoglucomutase [Lachnospiraceae bacterium]